MFSPSAERTLLARCSVQAPFKVQRPFYPEGNVCHVVTLHTAGGIVGGDRLSSTIHLQPNTHALLTTATAGKIYRSAGLESQLSTRIHVAAGACLEWLPQETIVFNGAISRQHNRIDLAEGALWIGWEITRFGRTARGERFASGEWRSRTEVWQEGRPLWVDPQWLQGGSAMLDSLHGLAGCPVVGSFSVVGQDLSPGLIDVARQFWQGRASTETLLPGSTIPQPVPLAQVGVTRLRQGMLCRYRGHSTLEARRWFAEVWHQVRQELLMRPACHPRVW
ncbi:MULTISPECIES: urease accessory protein UreD [unclassified Leptolyngbya]|uniref:urease accessory protein UreD n=1 Tax=unclassified Leptolyngbya TaxID=2650499 RepID=UPI00168343F2|nr:MULTISPECIES: urease accessory protein UreD [unclassified Leptolyngbya]MBD1910994.1 urease accessory protein UreD [Leptolyngbya sp. FACHB-8]MBD2158339.1 urease accessory protein UreD [Leptolyngbya sp. FACHB-16]